MAHVLGVAAGVVIVAVVLAARFGALFSRRYRSRQEAPPDLSRFSGGTTSDGGGNPGAPGGEGRS